MACNLFILCNYHGNNVAARSAFHCAGTYSLLQMPRYIRTAILKSVHFQPLRGVSPMFLALLRLSFFRRSTALPVLFLLCFFVTTTAHADLGFSLKDFGGKKVSGKDVSGKKVSGKRVSGIGLQVPGGGAGTGNGDNDGPDEPSPICESNPGNITTEASGTCDNKECYKTYSYVNLFNREYQDDLIDLSVKAPGGMLTIKRVYADEKWQFEHEYNRLQLKDLEQGIIHKGQLVYHRNEQGEYRYRSFRITQEENGFRWQNRYGSYVLYSSAGRVTETGNRNGVLARYTFSPEGHLLGISNRRNEKIFTFQNDPQTGHPVSVTDATGRTVHYSWKDKTLTSVTDVLGHITNYHYTPESSRLISKSDEVGRKFFITYYANGAVKSVLSRDDAGFYFSYKRPADGSYYAQATTSEGMEKEFWFDDEGHLKKAFVNGKLSRKESRDGTTRLIVDELGNRKTLSYDDNENLLSIHYDDGTTITHTYDEQNNRISSVNELGIETRFDYDQHGNMLFKKEAVQTASERMTEYGYDASGNRILTRSYDKEQAVDTVFVYDNNDNLISSTDPLGITSEFSYDIMGNVLSSVVDSTTVLTNSYDKAGHLIKSSRPGSPVVQYSYDSAGRRTTITTEGLVTTLAYDFRDNLISVTNPLGYKQRATFDKDNRLTSRTDAEGMTTSYTYNKGSRVARVTDGAGNKIDIHYSSPEGCGSCDKTFSSNPAQILYPTFERQYTYDRRGRMIKQSDIKKGEFFTSSFSYDKAGRLLQSTDQSGNVTAYSYDALNRIVSIKDPAGASTLYSYDNTDNLLSLTDGMGRTTRFSYDRNGRLISETMPMGTAISYSYDTLGRLSMKKDANNQKTRYNYDINGRLVSTTLFDQTGNPVKTVRFSYDIFGRMLSYDDGTTSGLIDYDKLGRKIRELVNYGPVSAGHTYSYYKNNLKKEYRGPDDRLHSYRYNRINRISRIDIDNVGTISMGPYNWLRPTSMTLPGNQKQEFSYDGFQRLLSIHATSPKDPALLALEYNYSPTGTIINRKTPQGSTSYSYDALNRLTGVTAKNGNTKELLEEYSYDAVHNRTSSLEDMYLYDDNNRLLDIGDKVTNSYDDQGNLLVSKAANSQTRYSYSAENRLETIESKSGRISYRYDPFGRRVAKTVDGKTTYFHYADEGLVAELGTDGRIIHAYSWIPGSPWGSNPLVMTEENIPYFYHNDHLGTPIKLTDKEGTVVWSAQYSTFGKADITQATVTNNLRFPGQYFDKETGLHYNQQRYYDPETGRYITADPIGLAGGINLYAYVQNDPVNAVDPTGLFSWLKFVGCMMGMSDREVRALRGAVPDEILTDPKIADELKKEIGELKKIYGRGWKKVRKRIIKRARKRAVDRAIKRMGRKAALKFLRGKVIEKMIPLWGQLSTLWDACKAGYCLGKAW